MLDEMKSSAVFAYNWKSQAHLKRLKRIFAVHLGGQNLRIYEIHVPLITKNID